MEEALIECLPRIEKLASDKSITELKLSFTTAYVYQQKAFNEDQPSLQISGAFMLSNASGKEEFVQEVSAILNEKGIEHDFDLSIKLKGEKFPTLINVKPLLDPEAKPTDLISKEGEVTLFDFWATWCGPCQGPMAHNQEMLENHPEWVGKVRIVGVSIDEDIEDPRKRVNDKNWTKVEHYWLPGGWGSNACKTFGIQEIPFCILVDKAGIIQRVGHPIEMNLDTTIPMLMADVDLKYSPGEEVLTLKDKSYTFAQCKEDMTKFVKEYEADIDALIMPLFTSIFTKTAKNGTIQTTEAFILVRFVWTKKVEENTKRIRDAIDSIFGLHMDIRMQERERKLYSVEFGVKCEKCGKLLGGCDQYLCVLCKPFVYLCTECVESHIDPKKEEDLPHPHGLYLIQRNSEPMMDQIVLGELKAGAGTITDKHHNSCRCDYCGAVPIGVRWKCANCPQVDVCDNCFQIARNPSDPKYQEILDKASASGHDMKTHIYVRQEFIQFVQLPY